MSDPLIGKSIGKYQIEHLLGRGATADVYKAYQPSLNRYVAIKILHSFLAEEEGFLIRFQREAQAAASLRHPRIVQIYDFDVEAGKYYMVMEFIDGTTLETKMQRVKDKGESILLEEAIRITREVASALAYAHAHSMVHRDIKPANVMITKENEVILADFGIAKMLSGTRHTATGSVIGTPNYMSPEQGLGEPGDARSDLYSLGILFFELITGQLPFDADSAVAVLLKHINDPIPVPTQVDSTLPSTVDTLILKALAKNPDDRHQTVDEFTDHLNRINASPSATGTRRATTIIDLPDTTAARADLLPQYTLSHGNVAVTPAHLPSVCDADWERAVNQFARGYIGAWLREGVNALRHAHRHGAADDLEPLATRAEAIVDRIREGDEIEWNAGLEEFLEFLGATPPILHTSLTELALPTVGAGEDGEPLTFTISNKGRGYLTGTITPRASWLQVIPARFGCRAGERREVTVVPDLSKLPAGPVEQEKALVIRSTGGDVYIAARTEILSSVLEYEPSPLDFGAIGCGESGNLMLTLYNRGQGFLRGWIECRASWLSAVADRFSVPAGERFQILLRAETHGLTPGKVNHAHGLVVESNGGRATVPVKMEVLPSQLQLEPSTLDLGTVDLAQGGLDREIGLMVHNTGHGVLTGSASATADWLEIEPASFLCHAGEGCELCLSIAKLVTGDHRETIHVTSNAGRTEMGFHLEVRFSMEPEMVRIPEGAFIRGSKAEDRQATTAEGPERSIHLSEYWIGKYPVTNDQYAAFIEATGREPPVHWTGPCPPGGLEDHPVVNVSWWDAVAYCRWLAETTEKSYRLPTEAQWEKAARGTAGNIYPWGDRWNKERCNARAAGVKGTTPVGRYSPDGDSPYGCVDMAGNVHEWVYDWYKRDYYARSAAAANPYGPAYGVVKVMRGGSWSAPSQAVRCASRAYGDQKLVSPEVGFRCAIASDSGEENAEDGL